MGGHRGNREIKHCLCFWAAEQLRQSNFIMHLLTLTPLFFSPLELQLRLSPPLSARRNSVSAFLFPDVKFQTQFPLPAWSVCGDESRAAAICINFHSVLPYVSPMNRDSVQHRLHEKPAVCSLFYLHVIAGLFLKWPDSNTRNSGRFWFIYPERQSLAAHWVLISVRFRFHSVAVFYL